MPYVKLAAIFARKPGQSR